MKGRAKNVYQMAGNLDTSMRFVVYSSAERLTKHKHSWKVWHTLRDFGCKVYVVAPGLTTYKGSKIYPDLNSLKGKVDVVIPCLRAEFLQDIVENTTGIDAKYIWFQENNWKQEFEVQCEENGIKAIRGCVLKHRIYKKPIAYFNPCYWHGWKEKKVPYKYERI